MKEFYKLADGSLSNQYEVGDTFVVVGNSRYFDRGSVILFAKDDGSGCPWFFSKYDRDDYYISWHKLEPSEETKRKYQKNSTSTFTKSDLQDGMRVTYRNGDSTSTFTKSDLQDGMRVTYRDGSVRIVLEGSLVYPSGETCGDYAKYTAGAELVDFNEDLTHGYVTELDIMCVEDRDGTLLFERQESATKRAVTLELTDEQIQSLKEQGIL